MSAPALSYTGLEQRPFSTHYVWAEAVIDHPVETVWGHAVDLPAWMGANHEWEHVAGETGRAGMFWRLWPRRHYVGGDECPPPHYHFVGIAKIIRHKLIGVEVWPEKGGSYGDKFVPASYRGLDNLLLTDLGGKTNLRGLFIATMDQQPDQQLDTNEEEEPAANVMLHFENLKKVINGQPLEPPATESFRNAGNA